MCVIGTFTNALPPVAALNSLQQLINCGVAQNRIQAAYWLIGHRVSRNRFLQQLAHLAPTQRQPRPCVDMRTNMNGKL